MKNYYQNDRDGYRQTIQKGLAAVRNFDLRPSPNSEPVELKLSRLKEAITTAQAIVIGAGAGLSTAAGFTYAGERFERYFGDFASQFGIQDMYSGSFYPFPSDRIRWAWWARSIYFNRYVNPPFPVYQELFDLVKDRNYFVITTNVDHQFQRAGFAKSRLFYTQGDYGLFQSLDQSDKTTYDNEDWVMTAMTAQGFVRDEQGVLQPPLGQAEMTLPSELIPRTPDGSLVTMNLRADDRFVEDEGWQQASAAYADFLEKHQNQAVLFLELGVGNNTPVIIKYPFWQMTKDNPRAIYACLNLEATCPQEIAKQTICLSGDLRYLIQELAR